MTKSEAVRSHLPTSPFSGSAVLVDFGSRQERITQPYSAMFKL
ncbi:hypothetical protein [Kitasatospora sp. McL0602]